MATRKAPTRRPKVTPLWYEFHCPANDCMGAGSIFRVYGSWVDDDLIVGHGMPLKPAQADQALARGVRCPFCHEVAVNRGEYRYNPQEPLMVGAGGI